MDLEGQTDQEKLEDYADDLEVQVEESDKDEEKSLEEVNEGVNATQNAKDYATENEVNLNQVTGSGAAGRVQKPDVQAYLGVAEESITEGQSQTAATSDVVDEPDEEEDSEEEVPEESVGARGGQRRWQLIKATISRRSARPSSFATGTASLARAISPIRRSSGTTTPPEGLRTSRVRNR